MFEKYSVEDQIPEDKRQDFMDEIKPLEETEVTLEHYDFKEEDFQESLKTAEGVYVFKPISDETYYNLLDKLLYDN